jgi:hypothetical protein
VNQKIITLRCDQMRDQFSPNMSLIWLVTDQTQIRPNLMCGEKIDLFSSTLFIFRLIIFNFDGSVTYENQKQHFQWLIRKWQLLMELRWVLLMGSWPTKNLCNCIRQFLLSKSKILYTDWFFIVRVCWKGTAILFYLATLSKMFNIEWKIVLKSWH